MNLQISLEQKQVLSQRMIQSMEILQMNALELDHFLKELSLENPLLELEDIQETPAQKSELQRKLEWLEAADEQNRIYYSQEYEEEDTRDAWNFPHDQEESLPQYVLAQLIPLTENERDQQIFYYLAYSLDSRGYLEDMPESLISSFGLNEEEAAEYLRCFQSVDPAGVGALNLKECLLLQLQRRGNKSALATTIIDQHLELLGKNQLPKIASATGAPLEEVRKASLAIKALNPIPSSGFSSRESLKYIQPDVTVVKFPGYFEILLNDHLHSQVSISPYYLRMLKQDSDSEAQDYMNEKLKQAEWIMACIKQRGNTLTAVTRALIEFQQDFFEHENGLLKPLRLIDVAKKLDVHESTVSRAVRDKYLQCSRGVYPMNYFFTHSVAAEGNAVLTPEQLKSRICNLIEGENKKKPYSDQKLTNLLKEEGASISRRTVAKYRVEIGIADASGRKNY